MISDAAHFNACEACTVQGDPDSEDVLAAEAYVMRNPLVLLSSKFNLKQILSKVHTLSDSKQGLSLTLLFLAVEGCVGFDGGYSR